MRAAGLTRALERLFAAFFLVHVPITVLVDLQVVWPAWHPPVLKEFLKWFITTFKDPVMLESPVWFKSLIYCEVFFHLPFFPFAIYAFLKGDCKWIRIPAIIFAAHVTTSMVPILAHFMFHDFSGSTPVGPETWSERLHLSAIYGLYFMFSLMLLFTMLFSPAYNLTEKRKTK
ncbi:sigma intracellular receptor 2-like [Eublepharis macularius]|uniref:Transmembrane protein 97 n=1 Tax=Eublepharis macularius TaxID=481883 RepID=A0AA97KIA9_EUBMA|nr:sigma intracellular receptor 2-like [Eublepharis macularius]